MRVSTYLLCQKGYFGHFAEPEERRERLDRLRRDLVEDGRLRVRSRIISAIAYTMSADTMRRKREVPA
jgi:hypothetical protein